MSAFYLAFGVCILLTLIFCACFKSVSLHSNAGCVLELLLIAQTLAFAWGSRLIRVLDCRLSAFTVHNFKTQSLKPRSLLFWFNCLRALVS